MRLSHIAFTFAALLASSSLAVASDDPITVNLSPKKHISKSAAIEVSACIPSPTIVCKYDVNTASKITSDNQFGVRILNEAASPTLDDAIASIKRIPNVSLRSKGQTTSVVVVWDRRL